jgi:ABC-type uncharacterized transport system permease subunit
MIVCGVPIEVLIVTVLVTTLRVATPLTLGALSGLFCERSGVVNIAIEGMMLMGAFSAYAVGTITSNIWLGVLAAPLSAALLAALHALLSVTFKIDQIISGTVVNILAFGMTGYFYDQYYARNAPPVGSLPTWEIPFLSEIPVYGNLFSHQPIIWTALLLVAVVHFVIFYTRWGLRTRAVGEHPRAADTVGINVFFMRYANVIIGGGIAGLAGAYFIAEVSSFTPGITAGRGFISLAALIFGKWTPFGAWGAALLFGLSSAAQINIQQCETGTVAGGGFLDILGGIPTWMVVVVAVLIIGLAALKRLNATRPQALPSWLSVFATRAPLGIISAMLIGLLLLGPLVVALRQYNLLQLIGILPYLVTIVVLAGLVGRATPPAAIGIPYEK